ncbi:hypothetical protein [Leptolyngbya sp. PCC 6406]|uniref:hypothetical protein n=1 Tax=Leptolyngbya sp. PCC 6406 TaxID=1173264 RepID=UPI0002F62EB8|nr:hypothetical protein [Leptolyngbya sp. PCC 6406]
MEFANEEALQDFLISYLENKGLSCYKEFPLTTGEFVDIVTNEYVIECKLRLSRKEIDSAAGQLLGRYLPHFFGRQGVIAGLSAPSGQSVAASLRRNGYQVWFLDEMPDLMEYYDIYTQTDEPEPEPYYQEPEPDLDEFAFYRDTQPTYRSTYRSSVDFGELVGIGIGGLIGLMVIIGAVSGGVQQAQQNAPVKQLHEAAIAWDPRSKHEAIQALRASGYDCNILLADTVEATWESAERSGFRGNVLYQKVFNRVDAMQQAISQQHPQCVYPPLRHPDQIP